MFIICTNIYCTNRFKNYSTHKMPYKNKKLATYETAGRLLLTANFKVK